MIRRDSPVPMYRQLADILRAAITAGQLAPGMPLPSEAALMAEYEVSRDTARKAVRTLRDESIVVTTSGKGTYVAEDG